MAKSKRYTIDELLTWFILYRRYVTADNNDPIGEVNFESEFWHFLMYLKNNEVS